MIDFKPATDWYVVRPVSYRDKKDYFQGISWPNNHLIDLVTISQDAHDEGDYDQEYGVGDVILVDLIPALHLKIGEIEYLLIHENDILGKVDQKESG